MSRETGVFKSKLFGTQYVDMRTEAEKKEDKNNHEKTKKTWEQKVTGSFCNGFVDGYYLFYLPKREWQVGDYGFTPELYYAFLVNPETNKVTKYADSWGRKFELPPVLS